MEYETPLDQLRPVSASNKKMDSSAIMDYNEIISGIGGQGPANQFEEPGQQHMQPPPPQYSQMPPQIAQHYDEPAIQQAMMAQQMQQAAQQTKEKKEPVQEGFISDNDQRDFLYIIVAIALLFSEDSQKYIATLMPGLFRDGKSSLVGLMFNAVILIIGLLIVRKVKISV